MHLEDRNDDMEYWRIFLPSELDIKKQILIECHCVPHPQTRCNFAALLQPVGRDEFLLMRARLVDELGARMKPLHCVDYSTWYLVSFQRAVDSTPISQVKSSTEI